MLFNFVIFIVFSIYFFLITLYLIILKLKLHTLFILLQITTKIQKLTRYFLTIIIIIFMIFIFIWRFYNRNRIILINKFKIYDTILNILEIYEINFFCIFLLLVICLLLMFFMLNINLMLLLYIKSVLYTVHLYWLTKKNYVYVFDLYNNINSKIILILCDILLFLDKYIHNPFCQLLFNIINYRRIWFSFLVSRLIIFIPLELLYVDIMYNDNISRFFYCLPWVYLIILLRMFIKIKDNVYGNKPIADIVISKILYKTINVRTYHLYCLTNTIKEI